MNKKNSKGVVERHLKQIQAKVRRPGIDRLRGIQTFKASFADTHFFDGFKKLFPLRASLHDYHGTPFPKYASQLFSNKAPRNPVQAYREILWAIARCSQFSDEISDFLTIRAEFESAVLKNNFQNAARSLREIEDRFGKSIWLYQNIISSAYISGSTQEPGVLAKQVVDEVKNTPILNLLVYYIRKRIEGAVLREKLGREIESHINSTFLSSYYQKKIFDVADSSDAAVTALLFLDAQASIIDHYDSLILSLQAAVADSMFVDEMTKVIKPALRQLHRKTRDRRLLGVLHLMGDDLGATSNDLDARRAQSIELYTIGEYDQCVGITKEILEEHPEDSPIRILYVKALVSLGRRPPSTNDLSSEINDNLYNVLAVTDQFFRSTHAIMVLSDRFLDHHWMLYLRVAVHYEVSAEQEKPIPAWMRDMYVRDPNLTPFLAMTLSSEDRVRFLSNCRLQEAYPHTLQLVSDFFSDDDSDTNNISPRSARYRARGSLVRKNYKRAFELYFLAAENEKNIAAKLKSLGGASLALMLDGQHHLAVDTLVDAYLNYQQAPILLPFHSLSHRLAEVDEWPNTIKLGILFHLANLFDEEGDLSRQRLAFEKFCTDNAITSPTDLMKREAEYGREIVIEYLDRVWRPEVMRQTLVYSSAEEIDEARIQACQVLARIDPSRFGIHQEELESRIKQQEILKATKLVEQSKVYVDIEAIKRSLRARLGSSYEQYKNALGQRDKRQDAEFLQFKDAILQKIESSSLSSVSLSTIFSKVYVLDNRTLTQSEIQFNALFSEITKEFLIGDHGLNAYLSTRVRHGKLVDALRKAVNDENLVTAQISGDSYAANVFWDERLSQFEYKDQLLEVLGIFCREFDATLYHVRDKLIHIRQIDDLHSKDENSEGLFPYHFSSLERRLMQTYDSDFKNLDQLIGKCVDILWEKTDLNLAKVRVELGNNVRTQLIAHFDKLNNDAMAICHNQIPSSFANAIAKARTATQQALENVITWFKRSEVYDRQDFHIDFPPQIAASMVRRTMSMPPEWTLFRSEVQEADDQLPGRTLDGLVDIFYVLLENAVKYAKSENIPLDVKLKLRYHEGKFVGEVQSKGCPPSTEQLQRLQQIRDSLATPDARKLAQREGKSGFRKIWMALDTPLYKSPQLDFTHQPSGDFLVLFSFSTVSTG